MRLHYNKLRRCWLENNCNGKRIKPGHLSAQQCHQSFRWWISCLQWGYVCGHFHLFFFSSFTSSLFFDIWVFLGFLVLTFPCFFFLQSQRAHINRWMESVWFYCQMHEQAHLAAIITLKFSSQLNKASFSHCNFILFFLYFICNRLSGKASCLSTINLEIWQTGCAIFTHRWLAESTSTSLDNMEWLCLSWGQESECLLWCKFEETV